MTPRLVAIHVSEGEVKNGHVYFQWATAIISNVFTITYGLQIGWVSSVTALLQSAHPPTGRPLTDTEITWLASLPALASMCTTFTFSWIVDRYGRRVGIMTIGFLQTIAWILCIPADPTCLIVSRIFCGIGAGGCYNVVSMFVKEISQDDMRGILGFTSIMGQNIGVLIIYGYAASMDYYVVLWTMAAIPLVNAILMLWAPESPVYLIKIGKSEEAAKTIALLRGLKVDDKIVQHEMENLRREDETFKSIPNFNFFEIYKNPAWRKGFFLVLMLMSTRGANGAAAIIMYAATILRKSGVTIDPELQSMSFPAFMIIGSFLAMFYVERLGRKVILVTLSLVVVCTFSGLAAMILVQESGRTIPGWVPVFLLVVVEFSFSAGVSPLPNIIMAEMFNFQIRAKLMGIITTVSWFMTFTQCFVFAYITNTYGVHISFFLIAAINFFCIVVTLFLPETKGKNIEQIENALVGKKDIDT